MQGLYAFKPWYTRRLGGIVDAAVARGVSPDVFTLAGVIAAAAAAVAVAYGWWPLVIVLLGARLAGANLDGAVARARGVSRPWGFVLNEIGDRTSDLVVFAGLAALAVRTGGSVVWVLVAALAATLPTFASLAAAGAGATRRNGGPFGKTERCLAVVVACALPAILGWVCIVIVAGSVLTTATRLVGTHRELAA
ncbi:CDP-alcohol phosphatidyltransferase [Mycobacterium sp. E802]|uniref:CDP-alcohol phosphatidyltransferase family protein n=1 Tax=Mycobacterium sp. E802 TaxID=1834152 RepID=UPI0007FCE058|nr:CDP-alcohol phosphatidyltransferase family protein [Mycobacterium sp. E802]OBG85489.1 CDP-alcohol phosphatidyltransferase [Mycobacterium sp. E802]